jgi:hypothetical protein
LENAVSHFVEMNSLPVFDLSHSPLWSRICRESVKAHH